jgi:hypothetical protein
MHYLSPSFPCPLPSFVMEGVQQSCRGGILVIYERGQLLPWQQQTADQTGLHTVHSFSVGVGGWSPRSTLLGHGLQGLG